MASPTPLTPPERSDSRHADLSEVAVLKTLGCLIALPVNGIATGTVNGQTFSEAAFAFEVTPRLAAIGILFAIFMGFVGGRPAALRAARRPVAAALREL